MTESSPLQPAELERAEWENVIVALSRTPRLAKFLRCIGELYFHDKSNEINEFYIATEVFGRSRSMFDSSRDSIARVEAHRLRKRLKEYYETDGKDHAVVISLPPGSYVPSFFHRKGVPTQRPIANPPAPKAVETPQPLETSETVSKESNLPAPLEPIVPNIRRRFSKRFMVGALAVCALFLAGVGLFVFGHWSSPSRSAGSDDHSANSQAMANSPSNPQRVPVRILAGYEGTPRIDSAGAYWEEDQYFAAGTARIRPDQVVIRTSDPMLFEHWRTNDCTYDIPLAPGPWELHLFFVAPQTAEANQSFFNVTANGKLLLGGFDISADALGSNIADERVFRDIYPDAEGRLHLAFSAAPTTPSVNAIELLPGLSHKQLPIRLVTQRSAVIDSQGNLWHPDTYFQSGKISDLPQSVGGTTEPKLYAQERFGHFTYSIPVDTRGRYTLVLHFAELYWGTDGSAGRRVFRVLCNGSTLLDNFDIYKEAGSLHALVKTFRHLRPSPEGKLDLTFDPIVNYATISAIEVIDESE